MANTISSLKRVRTTEGRTEVNRARKTRLRHSIRALRRLIEAKDPSGGVQIGLAIPVAQQADAFGNDMVFEFQLQLKMRPRDAAGFSRRYGQRKPRPPYLAR